MSDGAPARRSAPVRRWVVRAVTGGGSIRRQLVVATAVLGVAAAAVLVVLVQLVITHTTSTAVSRVLAERTASVVAAARAASTTTITVPAGQLEAGVAVYDGDGRVVAGAAPASLSDWYARLARSRRATTISLGDHARLRAAPFTTGGGTAAVVVVSERLQPYAEAEQDALTVTVGAGVVLVAASVALVAWVSQRALAPVALMAATAEDWSEHDLSRRFRLGPATNDLTRLGAVLDDLLDKVSAAIRSEQRLTSELAHELRTPLTAVAAGAELLLLHEELSEQVRAEVEDVRAGCRRMAETITTLLDLARSASSAATASTCSVREAVAEAVAGAPRRAGVRVDVSGVGAGERWSVPLALGVRALAPLVGNAVRFAGTRVSVSARRGPEGTLAVLVDDDGPGVAPSRRESIFVPGHTSGGGAGLGLALARRIARTGGGDVVLEGAPQVTRFRLSLPAAPPEGPGGR